MTLRAELPLSRKLSVPPRVKRREATPEGGIALGVALKVMAPAPGSYQTVAAAGST